MEALQTIVKNSANSNQLPTPSHIPYASDDNKTSLKFLIREELREMREREKRQYSIIVRGLQDASIDKVRDILKKISKHLINRELTL